MASDVHRKFLFEPNPAVWDRDFALMQKQGINLVRTGLWTAWTRVMLDPGAVDENVLLALDAYVLSAARHGIAVCFNLFAFIPPSFGGDEPVPRPALDRGPARVAHGAREPLPRHGLGALGPDQRALVRAAAGHLEEPADRRRVRARRVDRVGEGAARRRPGLIRDLWRDPGGRAVRPAPRRRDGVRLPARGRAGRARRATSASSRRTPPRAGCATLRGILEGAGGDVLVTLGQDEGGTCTRPAQSALLRLARLHVRAHVVEQRRPAVGRRDHEGPRGAEPAPGDGPHEPAGHGRLRRGARPELAANLLERKFAYAFAGRGTGVVEWAWNVNPYQPIDNEATIGFWRPDGTAKPELRSVPDFAQLLREGGAVPRRLRSRIQWSW